MKKTVKINGTTYNIYIHLDWLTEESVGGRRQHKVNVISENGKSKTYIIGNDLEKELKLIEEEIMNYNEMHSKEEQTLLKLGFKPGQLRDETSQTKRYCDGKLTQTERLGL
jgi:hypothetical protein